MFRIWSDLIIAIGFVIAISTYLSIGEHGFGALLLLSAGVLAGLGYLVSCAIAIIVWAARRRWARASTSATKAIAFVLLWPLCIQADDLIHLALFYPTYRREIDARPTDSTIPIRFDWGDKALWVTDGFQGETLVYDPTDALAASVSEAPWSDEHGFQVSTRHLIGRFYVEHRSSF